MRCPCVRLNEEVMIRLISMLSFEVRVFRRKVKNEYEKVIGKELCSLGHFYLKVRITKVIKYG